MAGDDERLVVLLEARIADFEKRMAQAERRGTQTYGRLRKDSASATRQMEQDMARAGTGINRALSVGASRVGAMGKAWAAGFIGGVVGGIAAAGMTGIISEVGRMAESIAQVGDEAKRAGVSAKAFQEWKFVAEQNRIGVDAMVDGLKELNLRADEFAVTGKGSAAEAFARLGYGAEEVKRKLEDPSALLLEIIGRMEQLDKAAQIRIADELFGGSAGERFVELLDQGEAGIRATIDRANELGVVMDDELIAKAADLDRRFGEVAATVGTALKSAIVSAADSLADFIDSFRSFENQRSASLEGRVNEIMQERAGLLERIAAAENKPGGGRATASMRGRVQSLTAEEDEIIGVLQSRTTIAPGTRPTDRTWTPPEYTPPPERDSGSGRGGGGGGRASRERADEFEREAEALVKRTQALKAGTLAQAEINPLLQDFGRAAEFASARTELLLAAQQAGLPITADLRARVDELAGAYAEAAAASAALEAGQAETMQRAEELADLRRDSVGGFAKDLMNGVEAADAFANALGRVGDRLLDLALDNLFAPRGGAVGGGAASGILSAIGGLVGFASGTADTGGRRGEVRGVVHGREAVIPLPSGGRVPVEVRGGASGRERAPANVTLNFSPTINAPGADAAGLARVRAELAQMRSSFMDQVHQAIADPRMRGAL